MRILSISQLIGLWFFICCLTGCIDVSSGEGEFAVCNYNPGANPDYSSAIIYYPCDTSAGPFAATTLTGGFTNTKEQVYWLGSHLASNGFIVLAITPSNVFGNTTVWQVAHNAGFQELIAENNNVDSPIANSVRVELINLMGFSYGGGGALLASHALAGSVATTIGLSPVISSEVLPISGVTANTLLISGSEDSIATPESVTTLFNRLDKASVKALVLLNGSTHRDGINSGAHHGKYKLLITAWLKVYLEGDLSYMTYLDGPEHDTHVLKDWFSSYLFNQ